MRTLKMLAPPIWLHPLGWWRLARLAWGVFWRYVVGDILEPWARPAALWLMIAIGWACFILALTGCASALRWFDASVTPPHDVRWFATGATLDAGLQLAKVPVGWRLAADATAASLVRLTPWFHKNLDSGLFVMSGATFAEILGLFIRGKP